MQVGTVDDTVAANINTVSRTDACVTGDFLMLGGCGMGWQVYIILCTDKSLYTGITTDVERRMAQHGTARGAKYFRGRKPRQLVYLEGGHTRSTASKREMAIKKMPRVDKDRLIESTVNEVHGFHQ